MVILSQGSRGRNEAAKEPSVSGVDSEFSFNRRHS